MLTTNSTFQFQKDFQNFSGQSGEFFLSFPGGNFFRSSFFLRFQLFVENFFTFIVSPITMIFNFIINILAAFFWLDNNSLSDLKNQQICTLGLFFCEMLPLLFTRREKKIAATNLFHFCQTLTITY